MDSIFKGLRIIALY